MFCRNQKALHLWLAAAVACVAFAAVWPSFAQAAEKAEQGEAAKDAEKDGEPAASEQPAKAEEPADAPPAPQADPPAEQTTDAPPAAQPDPPAEQKTDTPPAERNGEPNAGVRNPFEVGAKLLREVKASKAEAAKQPAPAPKPQQQLPMIKMTGVMIVGENKMAIADVEQYGTITMLKGEKFALQLKNRPEPFKFTVSEIEERQLVIVTDQGTEIRALFK